MATTDVAGSVTPTYTPTLPVTTDTSILTQADLTTVVVSLANRTEYVRQLVDDAADTPEASVVVREDFMSAVYTPLGATLQGDMLWRTAEVGSPAVNGVSRSFTSPGELVVQLPLSAEYRFQFDTNTSHNFSFGTLQHFTVRAKIKDDAANLNTGMRIGFHQDNSLVNGGTNSLALYYLKGLDATHWLLHVRRASVSLFFQLAPFVDDDYFTCRFVKVGSDIEVRDENNAVLHTVLAAAFPVGSCGLGAYCISSVADPNVSEHSFDFIFARGRPGR